MSTARSPQGFPLLVASLCGVVVAGVSATTGVAAHGMASTGPHSAVTGGGAFAAFLVCALVGVLTTAAAHRFPPALVVPSGLVGAQAAVHLVLEWTHGAHAVGHTAHEGLGHGVHLLYTPAEHSQLVREAMAAGTAADHGSMSWSMLAAHVVATVVTAAVLALIAGMLGWLSARADRLIGARVVIDSLPSPAPVARHPWVVTSSSLTSAGGVRGPPLLV